MLSTVLFTIAGHSDNLRIYVYPSPHGLDWATPRSLVTSAIMNHAELLWGQPIFPIGHMNVQLTCDVEGETHVLYTGMTHVVKNEPARFILDDGFGLGVLFHDFKGTLESAEGIKEEIAQGLRNGSMSFISFKISPTTCGRLMTFSKEYVKKGFEDHYGLPNRPRHGEGGGCSAYALTFLDLAGLVWPEFVEAWSKKILVPKSLIGESTNKVSLYDLLFSSLSRKWAEMTEAHRAIFFWEPDSVNAWITRKLKKPAPFMPIQDERAMGLYFDASLIPTPTEPIWK